MKADWHVHSCFSADAEVKPEEMIEEAITKGLRSICVTDHVDKDFFADGQEFVFDVDTYFQTWRNLQDEYHDKIDISIGVELGLQTLQKEFNESFVQKYPFDFVIGSIHQIQGKDPYYPEFFADKTDSEAYDMMLDETIRNIEVMKDFDVLGHLDYTVRYGKHGEREYSYQKYRDEIDEILQYLISHGKGLEINTAGLRYGLSFFHPHPDILKRYVELGGEILTLGSDAHKPEQIAYAFDKIEPVLKKCGVKYFTKFKNRKPIFEKIY